MSKAGEQQETLATLDDDAVLDYLLRHPDFFIRNAAMVEQIRVPHPVRGTVSLVEWHMARARNHINELEENMTLLMEQASANEGLFYRLLKLQGRLACAGSLQEMLERLNRWARDMGLRARAFACSLSAGGLARPPALPIWRCRVRRLSRCVSSVLASRRTIWER